MRTGAYEVGFIGDQRVLDEQRALIRQLNIYISLAGITVGTPRDAYEQLLLRLIVRPHIRN